VVVNDGRVWLPCKVLSKSDNYPRSYVVKLQNGQIVRRTSYHLRHTKGQHYVENYEDNDDIILGASSNEKVVNEKKIKDSQSNEEVVSKGSNGEITKQKLEELLKYQPS